MTAPVDNPDSRVAAEAVYWKAVCRYKQTYDYAMLGEAPEQLREKDAGSAWALKASVWEH